MKRLSLTVEYSIGAKLLLSFRIASGQQKALTKPHRRNLNGRRGSFVSHHFNSLFGFVVLPF